MQDQLSSYLSSTDVEFAATAGLSGVGEDCLSQLLLWGGTLAPLT